MYDIKEIWQKYHEELNYEKINSQCPGHFAITESQFLYSILRDIKPASVLEMSPDMGLTTLIILEALDKNDIPSKLYSFDINDLSLKYDRKEGKVQRELIFGDAKETLTDNHVENTDFFFIDSDHNIDFARWYSTKVKRMKSGIMLMIHDWPMYESMGACDNYIPGRAPPPEKQHPNCLEVSAIKEELINTGIVAPLLNVTDFLKDSSVSYHTVYKQGISPSQILIKN